MIFTKKEATLVWAGSPSSSSTRGLIGIVGPTTGWFRAGVLQKSEKKGPSDPRILQEPPGLVKSIGSEGEFLDEIWKNIGEICENRALWADLAWTPLWLDLSWRLADPELALG